MTVSASNHSSAWGQVFGALTAATLLAAATPATGVVVTNFNTIAPPTNGWVGNWYGSSAVPVAPNWVLSARHVGGAVGASFWMRGQTYQAAEIREHPVLDLQLVRLATPVPGWHSIADQPAVGTPVLLGGVGATTAAPLPGNLGWDWNGPHVETWGTNAIATTGTVLRVRFDAPGGGGDSHESTFAMNDSGAGLFVVGGGGQLQLAGTAVSVTGGGSSLYGASSYCVNLSTARDWITSITGVPDAPQIGDIFEFLTLWFARSPAADVDQNGTINVADIFVFLAAWFAG